ncbi:hypothetical protein AB0H18_08875 [Streptomyces sp. NPDC020766]
MRHARVDDIGRLTSAAGVPILDLTATEAEFAAQSPTQPLDA